MAIGKKSLWIGIVGMSLTIGGVAVAANAGEEDSPVQAAAPVTEAISQTDDDAIVPGAEGLGSIGTLPEAETTTTTTTTPPTTQPPPTAPPTTQASAPQPAPQPTAAPTTQAPPPPPPPTTAPPAPSVANRDSGCESYMYNAINSNRGSHLAFDSGIQYIAVNWSDHMSGSQTLAHNPNYGSQIAKHRSYSTAAENVGRGYHLDTLFQAFMDSPGHRHNIQNPAFSHVTVGCVRDSGGQYWVTQNFWG